MDVNEVVNQKGLISKAKNNYDFFVDSQHKINPKCSHVGYWLKRHSSHLIDESKEKRNGFIVYKPGTLIRVDFGVNVGSEITGSHFAVVLNKRDNEFNSVITVIPLTSKMKKNNINVGLEVFNRVIDECELSENKFNDEKKELLLLFSLLSMINEMDESNPELDRFMDYFYSYLCSKFSIDFELEKFKSLSDEDQANFAKTVLDKYTIYLSNVSSQIQKLNKVKETYTNKYRNNTYVDLSQITTISKFRIMSRINEFDPMGSIQVKDYILKQIRDELKSRLI